MTNPTADAAKLLPCPTFWVVERFENERSAGYWSGGNSRAFLTDIEKAIHFCRREDAMWTIMGWHWGDVKITEHTYIENTRPQPAPPAGEPDFEGLFAALLSEQRGIDAFKAATKFGERMYRLGLAARPKVEDASAQITFNRLVDSNRDLHERLQAAESALAEREAELANADAVCAALSFKSDMPDGADAIIDDATKRHAARQQQKAPAEKDKP